MASALAVTGVVIGAVTISSRAEIDSRDITLLLTVGRRDSTLRVDRVGLRDVYFGAARRDDCSLTLGIIDPNEPVNISFFLFAA